MKSSYYSIYIHEVKLLALKDQKGQRTFVRSTQENSLVMSEAS